MRFALFIACLILPVSAYAQEAKPAEAKEPDKPVADRSPSMGDAVATPASDLNLKKDTIPPLLLTAQERPIPWSVCGAVQKSLLPWVSWMPCWAPISICPPRPGIA